MEVHDPANYRADSHDKYPRFWNVPLLPSAPLMGSVGAATIENFYVVGEAWAHVVGALLPGGGSVLDIGCGCARTARFLLLARNIQYVGIDVFGPSIAWSNREVAPLGGGRFSFVHLDAHSEHYNPAGAMKPENVVFPLADSGMDLAFAASLFTHLLEPAAARYLAESARVLKPGGLLVASIHDEVGPGEKVKGDEARIDFSRAHFQAMARAAGLALSQDLGLVCGQTTFAFRKT